MKNNTQKLLVWLYSVPEERQHSLNYGQLELLLPDMSPGGRRSLIHYLTTKLLIRTERLADQSSIALTSHGMDAVEARFGVFQPARQAWDGQWSMMVFHTGPKGDPHFRYLRSLLLENHAFSLSRGVYLYPGQFPSAVMNVCQEIYIGAVTVLKANQWLFGDEKTIINEQYLLSDLVAVYSGVSKEVNQLLALKKIKKRLTKKTTLEIYSVFDRFFNVLITDPGFLHYYYPDIPTAAELLKQLHSVASES